MKLKNSAFVIFLSSSMSISLKEYSMAFYGLLYNLLISSLNFDAFSFASLFLLTSKRKNCSRIKVFDTTTLPIEGCGFQSILLNKKFVNMRWSIYALLNCSIICSTESKLNAFIPLLFYALESDGPIINFNKLLHNFKPQILSQITSSDQFFIFNLKKERN